MKVHVTLKKAVASDPGARRTALERVLAVGRMSLGNPRRFEQYGIITGEPAPGRIARIRAMPEVDAVELDEEAAETAEARPGRETLVLTLRRGCSNHDHSTGPPRSRYAPPRSQTIAQPGPNPRSWPAPDPHGPGSATSTLALLQRARRGDRDALDTLFARLLPSLRRWAHGRLGRNARDISDTADLVQQAVVGVLRHLGHFEPRRRNALRAYLHQAIRNRVTDELRRKVRRPPHVSVDDTDVAGGASPLALLLSSEREERFRRALAGLSLEERELVVARLELGYSYAQISVATGRPSPDAARMAVGRALLRLAEGMRSG